MNNLREKAQKMADDFLKYEGDYRMGYVEAEQSNPKTRTLDKTFAENPKDGTRKLLELISEFSKVVGYKINTQKYLAML